MPNRDGTGPRGFGRLNRKGGGQCRRNNVLNPGQQVNRRVQQMQNAGFTGGRMGALLGFVMAMLPIAMKATRLIGHSKRTRAEVRPAPKAVIVEGPPKLTEKTQKSKPS